MEKEDGRIHRLANYTNHPHILTIHKPTDIHKCNTSNVLHIKALKDSDIQKTWILIL